MTTNELITLIEKHIEEYDVWTDGDLRCENAMKKCVNELSGCIVYKEVV